jgi:hypothetical protein
MQEGPRLGRRRRKATAHEELRGLSATVGDVPKYPTAAAGYRCDAVSRSPATPLF